MEGGEGGGRAHLAPSLQRWPLPTTLLVQVTAASICPSRPWGGSSTLPTSMAWPWLTAPCCVLSHASHILQKMVPLLTPPHIILISVCHLVPTGIQADTNSREMESHRRMISRSDTLSDLHFRQLPVAVREGWLWKSEMGMGRDADAELGPSR